MATFDDVRRLGMALPEMTESTSYGTLALKVRKKLVCRMWSEREYNRDSVHDTEVLVVFCELEMKSVLLENHPDVLFTVPHYDGYGAVLVRMADVDLDDLADWLEDSYRHRAPPTLIRQLDVDNNDGL
ncbi:MmcQ/YjbR family DNA-binding protein [Candidatus Poriferisodalis sp.]|uniref:MmcQ/YjbR family DNA-binding protein n=1 Tax=Candidatus Poriferisodalis sp. TaxID=3101277 RepID=UPI003B5B5662